MLFMVHTFSLLVTMEPTMFPATALLSMLGECESVDVMCHGCCIVHSWDWSQRCTDSESTSIVEYHKSSTPASTN